MLACSPAPCAPADEWSRDARWPFHLGAALFGAMVAVTVALVGVACAQVEEAPFACEEGQSLEGEYRLGAHWCARVIDGRKQIDGRFVTWNGARDDAGRPGIRREVWYRAGRRHGPFFEYERPAPGEVQGELVHTGTYQWGVLIEGAGNFR